MIRNMDLVRSILLSMEDSNHGYFSGRLKIEGSSDEEVGYHVHLMNQAGLITACDISTDDSASPEAMPLSITWAGHEFIDNSRDQSIWEQSKEVINRAGGASLTIWSEVLKQTVLNNLGVNG